MENVYKTEIRDLTMIETDALLENIKKLKEKQMIAQYGLSEEDCEFSMEVEGALVEWHDDIVRLDYGIVSLKAVVTGVSFWGTYSLYDNRLGKEYSEDFKYSFNKGFIEVYRDRKENRASIGLFPVEIYADASKIKVFFQTERS
jgi:hypothetical protein